MVSRDEGVAQTYYNITPLPGDEAAIEEAQSKCRIYRTHASTTRANPEKQNQSKTKKTSEKVDFISSQPLNSTRIESKRSSYASVLPRKPSISHTPTQSPLTIRVNEILNHFELFQHYNKNNL